MQAAVGSKRARTDQAQEEPAPPPASAPRASTPVLKQQRALAQRQLSEAIKDARSDKAMGADLQQRVERLRGEGEQRRAQLPQLMASGDLRALASGTARALELQEECERCEEQLATLQQGRRGTQALAAVVAQQGVVADLLRLLVLQVRPLAVVRWRLVQGAEGDATTHAACHAVPNGRPQRRSASWHMT